MVIAPAEHEHDDDEHVDGPVRALEGDQLRMLLTIAPERYRLLRSHSWDDATVERLRGTLEPERGPLRDRLT